VLRHAARLLVLAGEAEPTGRAPALTAAEQRLVIAARDLLTAGGQQASPRLDRRRPYSTGGIRAGDRPLADVIPFPARRH
jgi:hypothetical protein